MAFVVVAHLHPSAQSYLAQILSRHTKMPVMIAATAMPIEANHVYVIPANADLTVERYGFKVVSPRAQGGASIDLFFISLAEDMGANAIGIIFSGYRDDGTEGCKHIKEKGGTTFAQDTTAEVDDMPLHARASGYVDFVLPPEKIPAELQRLVLLQR
jgi:chemotaxis response regulator CheB